MKELIGRRAFVKRSVGIATGMTMMGLSSIGLNGCSTKTPFSISLAQWSLHRALFDGDIQNLEFPRIARQEFDIDAIEYVNVFFKNKAENESYLKEMKSQSDSEGVKNLLIMCDGEGALGDSKSRARKKSVENHFKWVRAAKFLGCHSIRVNAQSNGTYDEQIKLAADGLRSLTEFGDKHKINVIVENHGGLSSNGEWLAAVIEKVDHHRCGTLPDFGNFRIKDENWYDRYKGVEELMPYAKAVSAKSHEFDDQGNEINTDFFKMMKIVIDAGYNGYVGIEYEGSMLSEIEGVKATKNLLERVKKNLNKL
ncbi:MAG: xylose isomerase [Candidatus Marinimicrobia bacterium]|nr:xylose isomerase [Candidatus Neomarinimicrobiota bacterium]|tara:strand:+ start:13645 stop:14574 length:930 start_codon:yes stop_codon:yes gene_type:complete